MENSLSNDRIIASHRNKVDYQESPANTLQFAYGDRRYVKMTLQLVDATDILKLKTLEEINEDFKRGDFINLALKSSDLLTIIIKHFKDKDDQIRELASRSVIQVCATEYGRSYIMEKAFIHDIALLINDSVPKIRTNSYLAMLNLTEFREGQDHFLVTNILNQLVDKLIEEKIDDILLLVLQLIKRVLDGEGGIDQILNTEAIKRLTVLLDHKKPQIREFAASNLASISFLDVGKVKEIELKCVLPLCKRLDDIESSVRETSTLALASLAQKNDAKQQILDYSYFTRIMDLLNDPSEQTKLNIIQLISSVAEHPVGRKKAFVSLDKLKSLKDDPANEFLAPYIQYTIDVITWKP